MVTNRLRRPDLWDMNELANVIYESRPNSERQIWSHWTDRQMRKTYIIETREFTNEQKIYEANKLNENV